MKIEIKLLAFIFAVSLMLLTSSCRSEFNEEVYSNNDQDQSLEADSKVVNLISRTAMSDGSIDNILDGSSCFNIQLPVMITLNDFVFTISNENDFELIEETINESVDDLDAINFIFPITIIFDNFSETNIENKAQLEEFINNCDTNEDDADIECIDFKYPFSASVFNQNSEVLKTFTFNNDNQLYRFIKKLKDDDIVAISFPITLVFSDSTEITINNVVDLENAIEEANNDCDEGDTSQDIFIQTIISQPLKVQKFKNNQNNQTNNYKDYVFDFSEDGTVQVTLDNNNGDDIITSGTWSIKTNARGRLKTTLNFGDENPLKKLNKRWNVKKIKENRILLNKKNNQEDSKDQLFFKKV